MITFRYHEDPTATIINVAAIVCLLGTLAFLLMAPKPDVRKIATQEQNTKFKVLIKTKDADKQTALAKNYVDQQSWSGPAQDVTGSAMATVSQLAVAHALKMSAFRPQRIDDKLIPTQVPFLVTVTGAYPAVVAFAKALDLPGTKIALTLMQVSASEDGSDLVTANLGLVSYLNPPLPPVPVVKSTTVITTRSLSGRAPKVIVQPGPATSSAPKPPVATSAVRKPIPATASVKVIKHG